MKKQERKQSCAATSMSPISHRCCPHLKQKGTHQKWKRENVTIFPQQNQNMEDSKNRDSELEPPIVQLENLEEKDGQTRVRRSVSA